MTFALTPDQDCNGTLVLDNTSLTDTYAFRVKTTAPDIYFVRPPMGLVPAGEKVTITFVVLAISVPEILSKRNEAIDAGTPVPFDRLLVMAAPVDQTHDFSTENEPKELSALWSTTRWKRKTKYHKFQARCFPKVDVSSDSGSEEDVVVGSTNNAFDYSQDNTPPLNHVNTIDAQTTPTKWAANVHQTDHIVPDNTDNNTDNTQMVITSLTTTSFDKDHLYPSTFATRLVQRQRSTSSSGLSISGASCDADDENDGDDISGSTPSREPKLNS